MTNFILPDGVTDSGKSNIKTIVVSDGLIEQVSPDAPEDTSIETIDLKGSVLAPGFIDLQINGCGGVLFNDDISESTLDIMHDTNLRSGCTSFLPTLITCSDEDMVKAVDVARRYKDKHPDRVPGLHIEGPYINKLRKGIHDERYIRQPSSEMIDFLCNNADVITMMTLAPEVCSSSDIRQLNQAGIIVAIGHSDATLEQVREAEQAGASFVTHLFNAMSQMQNREPGVVGAVLCGESLGAGIIADGYHLDWNNLRLSQKLLKDRLVLVSDAAAAAGSDIESFSFGGQTVYHANGMCTNKDGTLGGSALTMAEAVRNCIAQGISETDTVSMATRNPANAIGLTEVMGSIRVGSYANLVVLDKSYNVTGTASGGRLIMTRQT
ncbi:N-acetylglucosamine-6-phosphate deacetylase [Endozoicomonas montiporae]|uniref:N-acetylglucosamine-6-phosphate deacetylase n=1 Tax=Endozoicomonas montiporae TaxID=1027273 RepID=UPI001C9DA25A|nr:N-acetylglucosamine-6-phosphate deacetylase [Endozoicomonas montiporae]